MTSRQPIEHTPKADAVVARIGFEAEAVGRFQSIPAKHDYAPTRPAQHTACERIL